MLPTQQLSQGGPRPSPTPTSSFHSKQPSPPRPATSSTPAPAIPTPTNQDIEAIIQMATSNARANPGPPRDTRTQLFVGNLPYRVRWQDLKDLFRKAGTVLRADVSLGPDNRSRGYGTVLLATAEDAGRAIDMFNGYSWQTRILEVRHDRMPLDATVYDNNYAGGGAPQLSMSFHPQPPPALASSVSNPSFSDNAALLANVGLSGSVSASALGANGSVLSPSSPTQSSASGAAAAFSFGSHLNANSISRSGSRMGMHSAGRSLFVGNLPFQCQWQDLKDLFRQIGPVVRADVALGQDGRSRGFGTVLFQTEADADRAVKTLNGFEYNGRMIKVHHDRFTHNTTGTTSPPPFPALQPHMQLQQAASFMGTNSHHQSLIPSHIHTTAAGLSGGGFAAAPFHSQPTSPFDGFPPPMQLAAGQQQALYEQYLKQQQQQMVLQQPPVLQRSLTEQVMGSTATGSMVTANLVALQQEMLAKQLKEQVESMQQQQAASISQAPSVIGSRPSTSHGSGIAGSTRPASAMSSSASSGYVGLDYPSLLNPPPAPTPPTAASMMAGFGGVISNVPKSADSAMMDEEMPPPQTPSMNHNHHPSASSPTSNHPGTIAIPPPPSTFTTAAGGMMFSPLGRGGLPPMTPSMPGFTFHPQPGAGTPPGMMPHFLSPGIGPNSPPHFTGHLGRQGSFHAAPGGPQHPHSSMQAALAMMYGTPPMVHTPPVHPHHHHAAAHQYMMLTPGPRLDAAVAAAGSPVSVNGGAYPLSPGHPMQIQMQMQAWSPPIPPPGGEGMATPYAAVEGQRDYFVAAASAGQEEPTGYFPPVAPTTSSSSGGGGGSIGPSDAMSAEDSGSTGAPSSAPVLQDAAVIVDSSSSGSTESPISRKPPTSDPAATIRARVAGMTLDEKTVPSMVNEIAVASGLGMGTAKKAMVVAAAGGGGGSAQNGKLPTLWMSQKGRFNRSNAPSPLSGSSPEQEAVASFNSAAMGRNASGPLPKLNEKDVRMPMGMPGLPSPGRRASWAAEPGSRRPEVVAPSANEADSR